MPLREDGVGRLTSAAGLAGTPSLQGGGPFDRVLLDAPCSGSGRICLSDPGTYTLWTPDTFSRCALQGLTGMSSLGIAPRISTSPHPSMSSQAG
jgi:hypothetical protein